MGDCRYFILAWVFRDFFRSSGEWSERKLIDDTCEQEKHSPRQYKRSDSYLIVLWASRLASSKINHKLIVFLSVNCAIYFQDKTIPFCFSSSVEAFLTSCPRPTVSLKWPGHAYLSALTANGPTICSSCYIVWNALMAKTIWSQGGFQLTFLRFFCLSFGILSGDDLKICWPSN